MTKRTGPVPECKHLAPFDTHPPIWYLAALIQLQVTIDGHELSDRVCLRTSIVLLKPGRPSDLAAGREGSVLWEDEKHVTLGSTALLSQPLPLGRNARPGSRSDRRPC